jgi:hypothetical protein
MFLNVAAHAQVCGTVSSCPPASTPLSGAELVYLVQGGVSKQTTVNAIVQKAQGSGPISIGGTPVQNSTGGWLLYSNGGILGNEPQSALQIATSQLLGILNAAQFPALTGDVTTTPGSLATIISNGAVTNAKLANASMTVNGTTCTLGASCNPTAAAASIAVGTTGVTGGTSGDLLIDSAGTLGQISAASVNTPSTVVVRDASGNFSAGTITAALTGHASADLALSGGTMTGPITGADGGTWGSGGINGSAIGQTTASTIKATTLTTTGNTALGGTVTASALGTGTIGGSLCATTGGQFLYTAGANCYPGGTAASVAVGTTTVTAGTTAFLLFNNGGTLGNEALSSIVTPGAGIAISGTTALTISVNESVLTNSIPSNVSLNNISNYFDGPSVAQGSSGTWWAAGTVSVADSNASGGGIDCKLWDGTTVASSLFITTLPSGQASAVSLSGYLSNPAGNIRISCRDFVNTTGVMIANGSGNAKDSTISVHRIQ